MISGKSGLVRGIGLFSSMKNGRPVNCQPFNPVEHGLSEEFILTNFTKMKG